MMLIFTFLFSIASQTQTSAESACTMVGGQIKQLKIQSSQIKSMDFCFFDYAGMEIKTFERSRFAGFGGPDANQAYRATEQYDLQACEKHGGRKLFAKDGHGFQQDICYFFDRSAMDQRTLESGMSSIWNEKLNHALGIF